MKLLIRAAKEVEPEDNDIFEIMIIVESDAIEGVNGKQDKRLKHLKELRNGISNYIRHIGSGEDGKLVMWAAYPDTTTHKVSYYHPFQVLAPDRNPYPEDRAFKIRITYPTTYIGTEHILELQRGEKVTDFETIFIRDDHSGEFRDALEQAKAFIDSKIQEVYEHYKNSPDTMDQI